MSCANNIQIWNFCPHLAYASTYEQELVSVQHEANDMLNLRNTKPKQISVYHDIVGLPCFFASFESPNNLMEIKYTFVCWNDALVSTLK